MMDKSKWGPGPWQNENDENRWVTADGLACLIKRNYLGAWCGYVEAAYTREGLGNIYSLEVHGGVTFTEDIGHGVCVVGFDCAHSGDFVPELGARHLEECYATEKFAIAETEKLASQIYRRLRGQSPSKE
jgi:hypothetical protein